MIYYSRRTRKALAEGRDYLPLGFAHYSYGNVCCKFLKALHAERIEAHELIMPEVYPSPQYLLSTPERKCIGGPE
jgi:hypothetical protein